MPLDPLRGVLPNGIVVLAKESRTTPAVTILAGIRAGAFYDPDGHEGTAALAARVLDRGTATYTAEEMADLLDGRGAALSVMAGRHQLTVSATCLSDDFDAIFAMVADVIRHPAFESQEVETRRAELLTAILQDEDDPAAVAVDVLMSRLYPQHPYGRRPRGTLATVQAITRDDLVAFHRIWFTPEGTTLVVVGDVDPEAVVRAAVREFDSWDVARGPEPEMPPVHAPAARDLAVVPMMSKAQADVAYAFVGLRRADPDYYAGWVMNNALGQYALGGRLGDSIRERQGMAYYVYSSLDASLAKGPLMIRAGVAGSDVERTIASIDRELETVRDEGITEKEFDESKRYLIGSIPRQLETNAGIAGFLLSAEFHQLGPQHDRDLPGLLEQVGLDDANRVARRLLEPARADIVVAGPWAGPGSNATISTGTGAAAVPAVKPQSTASP
jgi:zinc protease